jgi:hypothetical protein
VVEAGPCPGERAFGLKGYSSASTHLCLEHICYQDWPRISVLYFIEETRIECLRDLNRRVISMAVNKRCARKECKQSCNAMAFRSIRTPTRCWNYPTGQMYYDFNTSPDLFATGKLSVTVPVTRAKGIYASLVVVEEKYLRVL